MFQTRKYSTVYEVSKDELNEVEFPGIGLGRIRWLRVYLDELL